MKSITVFTPSYNRAKLLHRCYISMQRQTCKDFIWMIIDDGSTDETKALVEEWQNNETTFEIRYYYKENGGLHTAYNEAIAHIDTPLCVCIDSDDWMPDNAVEIILMFWEENGSNQYAGIVGLDYTSDGQVIGDPLPNQKAVNLIDLAVGRYPIRNGDRTNILRTELYKQVAPMKVFTGEKNFNPHYMHILISKEYDFLVLNENLRFVEYQSSGMSNSMLRQYRNSPNSFAEIRLLNLSLPNLPLKYAIRQCIHLTSSGILAGRLLTMIRRSPKKLLTVLMVPFGWLLSLYIRIKVPGD